MVRRATRRDERRRSRRRLLPWPLLSLLLAATAASAAPAEPVSTGAPAPASPSLLGTEAPAIALPDLDGRRFLLSRLVGPRARSPQAAVVVNFLATWCKPCQRELPELDAALAPLRDAGVSLVLVDVRESEEEVRAWSAAAPEGSTILLDLYGKTAERWGVQSRIPQTFVVGGDGEVLLHQVGAPEGGAQSVLRAVQTALAAEDSGS